MPQKTQNKVICPICKEIGSIYRKKDKIRIPQKSQIRDFNSLLDFCSVTWFLRYKHGLQKLRSYSDNIPSHQPIFENHEQYLKHVPFSIHSETDIANLEGEIYSKIHKDGKENSGTRINLDMSNEFTQKDILRGIMVAAYAYISFTSLKRFNQYLEPFPITISDKDLNEIVSEFYKSVQYMSLDSRRVYSSLEQAKSVILNRSDSDFYYNLQPVYKDKKVRCTECHRKFILDEKASNDIRRYRCPQCYHKGGPISVGELTRVKPSMKYQRKVISKQLDTLDRHSQGAHNIFIILRNTYILDNKNNEEKYRRSFEECLSDFLNGIGPPDFKLAVRHYVPSKRNNSPCYLKTETELMNIRILDKEYLTALLEIFLAEHEGSEIHDRSISVAKSKLVHLKIPSTLITKKIAIDLDWIDYVLPSLTDSHIHATLMNVMSNLRNGIPHNKLMDSYLSEVKDRESLLAIYFNLLLDSLIKE